jgi:hypothetical protein
MYHITWGGPGTLIDISVVEWVCVGALPMYTQTGEREMKKAGERVREVR